MGRELECPIIKERLHLAGQVCKIDRRSNDERVARQQLVGRHLAHFFQNDACARDTICKTQMNSAIAPLRHVSHARRARVSRSRSTRWVTSRATPTDPRISPLGSFTSENVISMYSLPPFLCSARVIVG